MKQRPGFWVDLFSPTTVLFNVLKIICKGEKKKRGEKGRVLSAGGGVCVTELSCTVFDRVF